MIEKMETLARIHILVEEIREIARITEEFLESRNRGAWQIQQHELRRKRLEDIKAELQTLMKN
jgi:NADH:ubiquinone oxidoreductase subunit D